MKTTSIQQVVTLHATPDKVYDALMDAHQHAAFTGSPATISQEAGGTFAVFDGYAKGTNIELVPGKRIIQSWRADEEEWPEDQISIVHFELEPEGAGADTKVTFTQTGLPEPVADSIAQGWFEYYWDAMNSYFAGK
jgi:uncharacterized protein YndB with AHSA1/START domain